MKLFKNKINFLLLLIVTFSIIIRVSFLARYPSSLYSDEVDQGYNAYSILQTAKDEHGVFLPVSLRSFGDWKPPLPTYLMIPFVYLFGLNEVSVRLPSVILGIGTIILTYFLVRKLLHLNRVALLSAFFISISPWHILQSRSAMLVMIALFFLELGIFLFVQSIKNPKLIIASFVSFGFSIYSYYGMRVITPLVLLMLIFFYRKNVRFFIKWFAFACFVGFLILLPLFKMFLREPDVIFGRAKTVSVFYDQGIKLRQWELITQDGINSPPVISRFFHNNIYMYGRDILQRFLSHFDGRYLFFIGDKSLPFQIPNMGILYLADVIFIFAGLIMLLKNKFAEKYIILSWFLLSFFPAALTFMTPSSNRTFNAVVPYTIFTAMGISPIYKLAHKRILLIGIITFVYILSFGYFLRQYFYTLPVQHADFWNYGWREVVNYTQKTSGKYDQVVVADIGMPYIYFLFYGKYDPYKYQKEAIRAYVSDQYGFEHVEGFDKYIFVDNFTWNQLKNNLQPKTLYVVSGKDTLDDGKYLKIINYPDGKNAYKIFAHE
jgi:4-amino-4-deoxy-L-arabinose transferase-like glycosyltransferase